jgi:hypothetical protein
MEEYFPYYDWNTGIALEPWAWLLEEEEEWEVRHKGQGVDYHEALMPLYSDEYTRKTPLSINISRIYVDNAAKSVDKSVDKTVDNVCKNRKIIVNKHLR